VPRKQDDSNTSPNATNGNTNINTNTNTNTLYTNKTYTTCRVNDNDNNKLSDGSSTKATTTFLLFPISSSLKRKWFRGDRKKVVVVKSLIAFTVLYVWISLHSFQYSTPNGSGSTTTTTSNNNNNNVNTQHGHGTSGSTSSISHGYDSIFCRASTFQNDQMSSSSGNNPHPPPHNQTKPVFLWGIPSTTSNFETGRRKLLRSTYLDFYQQLHKDQKYQTDTNVKPSDILLNTICSFHDWTCNAMVRASCQMIYVFFIGGHEATSNTTPPILLNESITDFRDMLLPIDPYNKQQTKSGVDVHEPGTVYLDIRENQFDGKMTTWFKFASLVANEYNSQPQTTTATEISTITDDHPKIGYVFKVDSDLMLMTPHFLNWFDGVHGDQQKLQDTIPQQQQQQQLATTKNSTSPNHQKNSDLLRSSSRLLVRRVYGGIEFPPTNCVENFTFDHPCPLPLSGPSYMSGELNFVSVDLATYVASDDCPREQWTIPHEDVSLSNYVYSYINNKAYHKREQRENNNDPQHQRLGTINTRTHHNETETDHSIHIVGVNTSMVLLLPNMRANWQNVSIRKNQYVLRSGELLWGHSIKRGNYSQYLYWKRDAKFRNFWKLFYKVYTATGNVTFGGTSARNKFVKPNQLQQQDGK